MFLAVFVIHGVTGAVGLTLGSVNYTVPENCRER